MTDDEDPDRALYRLMSWLSPSYPVGAYTYSHGLEYAVEAGFICNAETARLWIEDLVTHGGGFSDAVFLAAAYRTIQSEDDVALAQVAELAAAFAPTAELALESHSQGRAFLEVTEKVGDCDALARLRETWSGPVAYPVAIGVAAASHGVALGATLVAYLHAFAANLVSAIVRLVPLGQTDSQHIMAALKETVVAVARQAEACRIEDLGTAVPMADICSMRHENQYTRLFRS